MLSPITAMPSVVRTAPAAFWIAGSAMALTRAVFLLGAMGLFVDAQGPLGIQRVDLPGGNILGAAISWDSRTAYFQQMIFHGGVRTSTFDRRVTIVDTKDLSLRASRELHPVGGRERLRMPCGDMKVGAVSGRVYLCSSANEIEILDGEHLTDVGHIGVIPKMEIRSFALDEALDLILLMVGGNYESDNPQVALVSIRSGKIIKSSPLGEQRFFQSRIILDERGGRAAVILNSNALLICELSTLVCGGFPGVRSISDGLFVGPNLLWVPGGLGDSTSSCVMRLHISGGKSDKVFCKTKTGVHFSVGIVANRYLVGFTGRNKQRLFSEVFESVSSSVSVWSLSSGTFVDTGLLPNDFTHLGAFPRILGSTGGIFLAFQSGFTSAVAFIGTITR